jgi:carbonic anhydrase/acetyltransferase-like protein (isoleucine patch superfamily)
LLIPFNEKKPSIHETVFVAPGAYLIGDVKVGKESTIWFNAVIRADEDAVVIGER